MADRPRHHPTRDNMDVDPDREAAKRTPRWPLVLGIVIAIALVAVMVLLHSIGTVGPGAH
jgi:hypothetical protein